MLYSEFLRGTEARDNAHNHEVYEAIEAVYNMHPTMDKEEAYEIAKPCIENGLSVQEEMILGYLDDTLNRIHLYIDHARENRDKLTEDGQTERAQAEAVDLARYRAQRDILKEVRAYVQTGRA